MQRLRRRHRPEHRYGIHCAARAARWLWPEHGVQQQPGLRMVQRPRPMVWQRSGRVAGGGDALQDQGAGRLLPVRLCGAERLRCGASRGSRGVHKMD